MFARTKWKNKRERTGQVVSTVISKKEGESLFPLRAIGMCHAVLAAYFVGTTGSLSGCVFINTLTHLGMDITL